LSYMFSSIVVTTHSLMLMVLPYTPKIRPLSLAYIETERCDL
jgi:hypothetical protein